MLRLQLRTHGFPIIAWLILIGLSVVFVRCQVLAVSDSDIPSQVPNDGDGLAVSLATSGKDASVRIERAALDHSLEIGRDFLLNTQRPDGTFRYRYNFITQETAPSQSAVRQAGALWGLALIHQHHPSAPTQAAVLRGLAFFSQHSRRLPDGRRFIRFPGAAEGDSGVVALTALALIDFLRAEPADRHAVQRQHLGEYLEFLKSIQRADRQFYKRYLLKTGEGWGQPSPYFDGEILLAMTRAACYHQRDDLRPVALAAADAAFDAYVAPALANERDDAEMKGFFQWGCMAYGVLHQSQWPGTMKYAQRTVDMAHWMIDVHRTLDRPGNTGYAYEGIIVAYRMAQQIGDTKAERKFLTVIESGLGRLLTWQVGALEMNAFLASHPTNDPTVVGGVLGAADDPWLRVDTTQHQMHAVILARRYVFKN